MVKMNRQRREDFRLAQKQMEDDALQTARVAFLNGSATDAQARLVEDAIRKAEETGTKLPPILSPPKWQTERNAAAAATTAAPAVAEARAKEGGSIWDKVDAQVKAEGGGVGAKARDAYEKELGNQRNGGPLDKLGTEAGAPKEGSGKKWWPW
jgi:hypothetical protein